MKTCLSDNVPAREREQERSAEGRYAVCERYGATVRCASQPPPPAVAVAAFASAAILVQCFRRRHSGCLHEGRRAELAMSACQERAEKGVVSLRSRPPARPSSFIFRRRSRPAQRFHHNADARCRAKMPQPCHNTRNTDTDSDNERRPPPSQAAQFSAGEPEMRRRTP